MCLGIPAKIVALRDSGILRLGTVESGSVRREVSLDLVPEAEVGDYVIVHAGFAIGRLNEEEAQLTLRYVRVTAEESTYD